MFICTVVQLRGERVKNKYWHKYLPVEAIRLQPRRVKIKHTFYFNKIIS